MQTIKVIKPKRACEILKEHGMAITEVKLDMGLRQRVFPFGDAIEMRSEWDYIIYEHLLRKSGLRRGVLNKGGIINA